MIQTSFPDRALMAREVARMLLEIEAVHFRPDPPFMLTSGLASPVYIDCRKLISYPAARRRVMEAAVATMDRAVGFDAIDAVAGGETAGIPYAAWMAEATSLPMLYVRKKPKGFGRNAQIEGDLKPGSRVLLVEDLATDGASKIIFVNALRDAGATVTDAFVIFFYGVFPGATQALEDSGVRLHHLATWWDVLDVARARGLYTPEQLDTVEAYLDDPDGWSAARE